MNNNLYATHWSWVISSYIAEGLPYAIINSLGIVFLADMSVSNDQATKIISAISMAWAIKALWSPVVEIFKSKRWWMWILQIVMAASFILLAIILQWSWSLTSVILLLTLIAFSSATYDIACDGYYMQTLPSDGQSFFVGVRNTAYRLATIFASGFLLALAGIFEDLYPVAYTHFSHASLPGEAPIFAWSSTFGVIALLFFILSITLKRVLPHNKNAENLDLKQPTRKHNERKQSKHIIEEFVKTIKSFLAKGRTLIIMFSFLLLFRLGESLLSKVSILFLKDSTLNGGIALSNVQLGFIHGTIGVLALIIGGILGGFYIARHSLRKSIIPMALMLNVPDLLYVWMAHSLPTNLWIIGSCVAIEQFGYGFGLTAYTVYMLQAAKGRYATAHYAIITALMAIGMNIPSFFSGKLQLEFGYYHYFIITCIATLPGIFLSWIMWKYPKMMFDDKQSND